VQEARGFAETVLREPAVEKRRDEGLAGRQAVAEVEVVEAAHHAHEALRGALDGDLPVPAPGERAEPDAALLLVRAAVLVDGEEGVGLVARRAAPALEDLLPGWIVSRTICVSLAQRPARWVRR
jgi:hypothetical protein